MDYYSQVQLVQNILLKAEIQIKETVYFFCHLQTCQLHFQFHYEWYHD